MVSVDCSQISSTGKKEVELSDGDKPSRVRVAQAVLNTSFTPVSQIRISTSVEYLNVPPSAPREQDVRDLEAASALPEQDVRDLEAASALPEQDVRDLEAASAPPEQDVRDLEADGSLQTNQILSIATTILSVVIVAVLVLLPFLTGIGAVASAVALFLYPSIWSVAYIFSFVICLYACMGSSGLLLVCCGCK